MWLDNLKELKKSSGMTSQQISDATKIPQSTIKRIFAGITDDPYVSTIQRIVIALGGSLDYVLADTNAILSSNSVAEVKETADAMAAERDMIIAENTVLKDKIAALTAENAILKDKIDSLKDEIIETHHYYIKLNYKK